MEKNYDNNGHKNLELLRFYINREINKIDENLSNNSSHIIACLFASLIDICIVIIFDESLKQLPPIGKIIHLLIIVALLYPLKKIIMFALCYKEIIKKMSGASRSNRKDIQEKVDEFDNIACDGLLICQYYIERYKKEEAPHIKEFYYYEIIHHLKKSFKIFSGISANKDKYIYVPKNLNEEPKKSLKNDKKTKKKTEIGVELIDKYRIINYLVFAKEINEFLQSQMKEEQDNRNQENDKNPNANRKAFEHILTVDDEVINEIGDIDDKIKKWCKDYTV